MKNDNLGDFLTDIAIAIREKKGTTEAINAQNFSEEIRGIESGGGGIPTAEWNDVNFYDYEGAILYSYSWDEFVAKNEMPPLPTHHEGLTCQGWNYTLEEVLEQGGRCDVGAIYIPTDGKTHIIVEVNDIEVDDVYFSGSAPSGGGVVTIDWGDGNIQEYAEGKQHEFYHKYQEIGEYDIAISAKQGIGSLRIGHTVRIPATKLFLSDNMSFYTDSNILKSQIREVTASLKSSLNGSSLYLRHYNASKPANSLSFLAGQGMETVSLHPNHRDIGGYDLNGQRHLKHLHLPSKINPISALMPSIDFLKSISCSKANQYIYEKSGCVIKNGAVWRGSLYARIPEEAKEISSRAFMGLQIKHIQIPSGVTKISDYAFQGTNIIDMVVMPEALESLGASSFASISTCKGYDFSNSTKIPVLSSKYDLTGASNWVIVVPDNLYDEWIASTNWSGLASRIVKASEYVEPTNE